MALEAREAEGAEQLRRLELDRLDAVQQALWDDAMGGDARAVTALLRVIDLRTRLMGLQPSGGRKWTPQDAWPSCVVPATVVVHPDDCRHAGCARHGSFAELTPA